MIHDFQIKENLKSFAIHDRLGERCFVGSWVIYFNDNDYQITCGEIMSIVNEDVEILCKDGTTMTKNISRILKCPNEFAYKITKVDFPNVPGEFEFYLPD